MSAPLYLTPTAGRSHVRGLGRMESMMAFDTAVARASCAWMCRHRTTASWVVVVVKPRLPVPLARRGVLHAWPTYLATMEHLVLHSEWQAALATLSTARVPLLFAAGDRDPVPVPGRTAQLAEQYPTVTSTLHPTADHDLPLVEPAWCMRLLDDSPTRSNVAPTSPKEDPGCAAPG